MSLLKFIHMTDLHLTGTGEHAAGYDTFMITDRALNHAMRLFPDAEFLVITGDLANWGERDAYEKLKARLAEIEMPVYLMIGNHDNRDNFFSVFGDRHPYALPFAQYTGRAGDYDLVFLDSQTTGTHGGALSPPRLRWLDDTLEASDRDVLLFMHHHPVAVGAPSLDAKGLANWPDFHAVLARHRNKIRHIFHGHCHTLLQGNVEGVSFTGLRSMSDQAYTDLKIERAARWYTEPHYGVVLVTPNSLVTHIHEFNYAGPLLVRDRQKFEEFVHLCAERGVSVPLEEPLTNAAE